MCKLRRWLTQEYFAWPWPKPALMSNNQLLSQYTGQSLYVPCGSVYNCWDQNQPVYFLRANQGIEETTKPQQQQINNATMAAICLLNIWNYCKSAIKNLDPYHKCFNREHKAGAFKNEVTQPTYRHTFQCQSRAQNILWETKSTIFVHWTTVSQLQWYKF